MRKKFLSVCTFIGLFFFGSLLVGNVYGKEKSSITKKNACIYCLSCKKLHKVVSGAYCLQCKLFLKYGKAGQRCQKCNQFLIKVIKDCPTSKDASNQILNNQLSSKKSVKKIPKKKEFYSLAVKNLKNGWNKRNNVLIFRFPDKFDWRTYHLSSFVGESKSKNLRYPFAIKNEKPTVSLVIGKINSKFFLSLSPIPFSAKNDSKIVKGDRIISIKVEKGFKMGLVMLRRTKVLLVCEKSFLIRVFSHFKRRSDLHLYPRKVSISCGLILFEQNLLK